MRAVSSCFGLPLVVVLVLAAAPGPAHADGKMFVPRDYKGSLEERAQEAIIIFHGSEQAGGATEDVILKVHVAGQATSFAWVIPFPTQPKIAKEDARLFQELFDYVETRRGQTMKKGKSDGALGAARPSAEAKAVDVLSRKVVGSYDTAVVRENVAGALNQWLAAEGFQPAPEGDDVVGFYRKKGYVFACIKVSAAELAKDKKVDLHPLRFSFKTGGRDGVFYPMKLTGLQSEPFDVNLYVFYGAWLNDRLNKFGYVHRGFRLHFRDWDSPACKPNAGKAWSAPQTDPYLKSMASRLPAITRLFQRLHPGERYYLTNLRAHRLVPEEVRAWSDDLWLFPYYVNRRFVPFDARPGGPASASWPNLRASAEDSAPGRRLSTPLAVLAGVVGLSAVAAVVGFAVGRRRGEPFGRAPRVPAGVEPDASAASDDEQEETE